MKKLIIILFMFHFLAYGQDNWQFKTDKGLHFGAGVVIAAPSLLLLYNATNEWVGSTNASILIVACAASGKETFDMLKQIATNKGNGFDWIDWTYTIIGGVVGVLITTYLVKRKKKKQRNKKLIEF